MWFKIGSYIASAILGGSLVFAIVKQSQPEIKIETRQCPDIPQTVKCEGNGIDFDKIKNVKGLTIANHQYFVVNSDSLSRDMLKSIVREVVTEVIREQRAVRCR